NLGQQALLRYHNIYQREDLESAVQRFECARCDCPLTHRCRAAVLVNVAKAKFISYQADPTSADLDEVILLYREALSLRSPGHPDRPATLLLLARTLLFRYEKQGCDESVADEINELVSKSQNFSEDSHERRAADLVLETLERYRIVKSGSLSELDGLVHKLEHSAKVPPDGYFDIPQRLINLSTTLWRRYEKRGELDDLNYSLDINQQALQMLPARDPGRLAGLRTLGAALWRLFELRRDLSYLRELIALDEEALQLIPEGHPERPYWVTSEFLYFQFCRCRHEHIAQIIRVIVLKCWNTLATQPSKPENMTKQLHSTLRLSRCYGHPPHDSDPSGSSVGKRKDICTFV
ncbi:hypothetical protein F5141DRAFT_1014543, partial [Pisolithus sp. B1]